MSVRPKVEAGPIAVHLGIDREHPHPDGRHLIIVRIPSSGTTIGHRRLADLPMPASRSNRESDSSHPSPAAWPADRLERVAVPLGDGRTLAFVRGTVLHVESSQLTLGGANGRRSGLQVTAKTAYGTPRLPTALADLIPGTVVAALVEQLEGHQDLALRIVAVPSPPSWSPPPTSTA
jgi:hypothetical protein